LNRTPATDTNRRTYTFSFWYKRGTLNSGANIGIGCVGSSSSNCQRIMFSLDSLRFDQVVGGTVTGALVTTQVFRDPSAWYHIVIACDTTQATAANRWKIYVNGSQVTSFSTATYIAQNDQGYYNTTVAHVWGYADPTPTYYADGYMAEVNFVDGQQLTPSSFGSTNSTTGVWQPAKYTSTYGTNGFYLPFTDNSALTTSSNVGLGKDFSGNANYWVTNNISLTAGVTYDSMTDVPTLTSATAANFAVLNPLNKAANDTISNANFLFTGGTSGAIGFCPATIGVSSGKWYWEVTYGSAVASGGAYVGIVTTTTQNSGNFGAGQFAGGYDYNLRTGQKYNNGTSTAYGATATTGDIIGVALDLDGGTLTYYKNNTSQGTAFTSLSGTFAPEVGHDDYRDPAFSINFGQRPFSYTPPSGYVALNTYNLPASTVPNGASYMAATLYTGTGASLTVANTVGSASFQPDLVWIKSRSAATDHKLTDVVRGVTKALISNTTGAETTDTNGLTAFGSTGFTVGTDTNYNNSATTYAAWNWKAGGTGVSNTNGTITSTVSANTTSGCSVIKYISNGTNGATVGHGLGVAPSLVIVKCTYTGTTQAWAVYHASLGATQYLTLQSTDAATTSSAYWNNTAPSSSVFTIGTSNDVNINSSVYTYAAYCFAAIKGFSAFGSYTGNGSTDGPFVYLGFRPRFVMVKRTDSTGDWQILDSSRSTYNAADARLIADLNIAEINNTGGNTDFLSNGFKFKNVNGDDNASGGTFIYAAFAESPFQNSLAR
jgi:hypothetical protein